MSTALLKTILSDVIASFPVSFSKGTSDALASGDCFFQDPTGQCRLEYSHLKNRNHQNIDKEIKK